MEYFKGVQKMKYRSVPIAARRVTSKIMSHLAQFIDQDISQLDFNKAEIECYYIVKSEFNRMAENGYKFQELTKFATDSERLELDKMERMEENGEYKA